MEQSASTTGTTVTAKDTSGKAGARKLSLLMLSGVVIASMIGGGAFNLQQNIAREAGLAAVVLAWAITLLGMYFLSNTFRILAAHRPDLRAGIYSYAQTGFGAFAGFLMAWGYWLSALFGNVAFAVLVMQVLSYFFPVFSNGHDWPFFVGGSALIWTMRLTVISGIKRSAVLNVVASILNIATIGFVVVVLIFFVSGGAFSFDVWGRAASLGSLFAQVKSTMLVTLWVFIGIEAAVVISDRARNMSDVGPATFIGLGVSTVLYSLLSILPFGIMHQDAIARLGNPSAAYILSAVVGTWGGVFVNVSLLAAVLSSWLAWTVLMAELPFQGAKAGVFPSFLALENAVHAPSPSLWLSSAIMQLALFAVLFVHDGWLWLIDITGIMILPPYVASTLFLVRSASSATYSASPWARREAMITGVLGSMYGLWLLYAAGLQFILMSTVIFAAGIPVFWYSRRQQSPGVAVFSGRERIAVGALLIAALSAATALVQNDGAVL